MSSRRLAPPSLKTLVIQRLFEQRYDPATGTLSNPMVTLEDVRKAIEWANSQYPSKSLSTRNPANFMKDIIRRKSSANRIWPQSVFEAGYTGEQVTGNGLCFRFVPIQPGQTEPFPVQGIIPGPDALTPEHVVQSLSLPLASRHLGRKDEAWLTQVVVKLNIIETHMAMYPDLKFVQIDHLQNTVKLRRTEIDAIYLGTVKDTLEKVYITCEAKGRNDDVIETQIVAQVKAAFTLTSDCDTVVPVAIKVVGPSRIYVIAFKPVSRADAATYQIPEVAHKAVYKLVPPVPGI